MAVTQDTTGIADLKTRVDGLAGLPALLKPYTATGTKLRLPKEIGDKLRGLDELRRVLDEVHYEGVHYEYQDESATASDRPELVTEGFARRAAALGYML